MRLDSSGEQLKLVLVKPLAQGLIQYEKEKGSPKIGSLVLVGAVSLCVCRLFVSTPKTQ